MAVKTGTHTDKDDRVNPPKKRTINFKPSNRGIFRKLVLGLMIFLIAFSGSYTGVMLANNNSDKSILGGTGVGDKKITTSQSQLISRIVKRVSPSVVSINVVIAETQDLNFGGFAVPNVPSGREAVGAGTGVIVSEDGVVITNRHVVPEGVTRLSVTLSDGTELKDVSVIGRTNSSDSLDIAFLKIHNTKGQKLKPAVVGDSGQVDVGDDVIAIGNALGRFQNTVTAGIISGYGRNVLAGDGSGSLAGAEVLDNLFQTDAAINAGNSGGPLMNLNGQVVGINTAIAGGNAQNIGFAIPVNDIKGLLKQVLETGKFERPYLGVRYLLLNPEVADEYDLETREGAYIVPSQDMNNSSIIAGSPAEQAGLKERDIITSVDGKKVDQKHSLTSLLAQNKPGDRVELRVIRNGETIKITAKLGALPKIQGNQ